MAMTGSSIDAPAWFAIQFLGVPLPAVLGGLLIGLAAVVLYLSIGRIAGISGIFFRVWLRSCAITWPRSRSLWL